MFLHFFVFIIVTQLWHQHLPSIATLLVQFLASSADSVRFAAASSLACLCSLPLACRTAPPLQPDQSNQIIFDVAALVRYAVEALRLSASIKLAGGTTKTPLTASYSSRSSKVASSQSPSPSCPFSVTSLSSLPQVSQIFVARGCALLLCKINRSVYEEDSLSNPGYPLLKTVVAQLTGLQPQPSGTTTSIDINSVMVREAHCDPEVRMHIAYALSYILSTMADITSQIPWGFYSLSSFTSTSSTNRISTTTSTKSPPIPGIKAERQTASTTVLPSARPPRYIVPDVLVPTLSSSQVSSSSSTSSAPSLSSVPLDLRPHSATYVILQRLFTSASDYAVDNRGDVGSWVREAMMRGLSSAIESCVRHTLPISPQLGEPTTKLPTIQWSSWITSEFLAIFVSLLLQQSAEKIDRIRKVAMEALATLLYLPQVNIKCYGDADVKPLAVLPIPWGYAIRTHLFIAADATGRALASDPTSSPSSSTSPPTLSPPPFISPLLTLLDFSNPSVVFPILGRLLSYEIYRESIVSGFIQSVGGLTDSTLKHAVAAIRSYCLEKSLGVTPSNSSSSSPGSSDTSPNSLVLAPSVLSSRFPSGCPRPTLSHAYWSELPINQTNANPSSSNSLPPLSRSADLLWLVLLNMYAHRGDARVAVPSLLTIRVLISHRAVGRLSSTETMELCDQVRFSHY